MPETELTVLMNGHTETALQLLVALLLGALVGLQRGWVVREQLPGTRVAGIRTHALTGLTGGIATLLAMQLTIWLLPVFLLIVAAMAIAGYRAQAVSTQNFSITGMVGLLLTFCFGALAMAGETVTAAMAAVVTTMILDNKQEIHNALRKLQEHELDAALKLLLISVVMLPLLPRQGIGPGEVINLYEIWWMVVLIASVSFIGYFSVRIAGPEKGLLFTGFFGGLSSSTATTLHFSRLARSAPQSSGLLAAGILLACGTMFPRVLLYGYLINPALLSLLLWPMLLMMLALYLPAGFMLYRHRGVAVEHPALASNPLELRSAVILGALVVMILLLAEWLREGLGDQGMYLLAAVSGVTDIDAITLSLARLSLTDTFHTEAIVVGIFIAANMNNLFKTLLAFSIGKAALGIKVGGAMLLALLLGGGLLFWS